MTPIDTRFFTLSATTMMTEQILNSKLSEDEDGYAIPAADLLADWFIEHGDDPHEGDPATWPDEYDSIRVSIGPVILPQERLDLPLDDTLSEVPF